MKKLLFSSVYFLFLFCIGSNLFAQNFDLKNYVWRKRILLIFAPNAENELYKRQILATKTGIKDFQERDLIVISIFNQSGFDEKNQSIYIDKVAILRRRYKVLENEFRAILIGKDGGDKASNIQPFKNQQLFNMIDAMPMRQDEVKKGSE
jgi:hypothetical protein